MSDAPGIPFWGVVGFTILALCSFLALFAVSFGAGLDFLDESLYVFLLSTPRTVMAFMDHVVWGRLLAPFPWTIVHLRWLAVVGTTFSVGLLVAAVFRWMGPLSARRSDTLLSYAVASALSLFGALFYFTSIRSTFSYTTTLVMMPCLFVAAMLWRQMLSGRASRLIALAAMAVCCAMSFLAKPTTPVLLLLVFVGFNLLEGSKIREISTALTALIGATVALVALTIPIGYDPAGQALLINASAGSSHPLTRLIGEDMLYGARIVVFAVCGAAALGILSRGSGAKDRYGKLLLIGLCLLALEILVRDGFRGRYSSATTVYARNLGETLHAFTLALVLDRFAPILSARWRFLRRIFPPRPATTDNRRLAALTLALYGACLAGFWGTNTGLWTRSVMNMGPLFLLSAILLLHRFKEERMSRWALSVMVVPFYILLFPPLYVNQYSRPPWVEPVAKQTVRLDHPAVLRGLWVTPEIARLQATLEQHLRAVEFDRRSDRIVPGDSRDGMVLLAGAYSLGTPYMTAKYANPDRWNCAVIRLGLRQPPRRIIGIDLGTLGRATLDCLRAYGNVGPIAHKVTYGEVTVIKPYSATRRRAADGPVLETED